MVDPSKYIVIDVETNGLKPKEHDLLSISIFKPDDGKAFNRLLPLEKQNHLNNEAARIHGIKEKDLRGLSPLCQEEVDNLIEDFEMNSRTVLSYGGRGFDERFLKQYFKDHYLTGLEYVTFFDFKTMVHSYGNHDYPASKDNLCTAFGISGVTKTHTSENDCRLEWELFEKMEGNHLLVTGPDVYKLTPEYIIPASYIDRYTGMKKYVGHQKRCAKWKRVFELKLSPTASMAIEGFESHYIDGALKRTIGEMLEAEIIDSRDFLLANKMKLELIGSFSDITRQEPLEQIVSHKSVTSRDELSAAVSKLAEVDSLEALRSALSAYGDTGSLSESLRSIPNALYEMSIALQGYYGHDLARLLTPIYARGISDDAYSAVDTFVKSELCPLLSFLGDELGENVLRGELVVNKEDNCLALCNLSSNTAVVEINTSYRAAKLQKNINSFYYRSAGRNFFVLHAKREASTLESGERSCAITLAIDQIRFAEASSRNISRTPGAGSSERLTRIMHAVSDWQYANPDSLDPKACARALWLDEAEVRDIWDISSKIGLRSYAYRPKRGKVRERFLEIVRWRKKNPLGTRLALAGELGYDIREVQRLWFVAELELKASDESFGGFPNDDASIRQAISDLVDSNYTSTP